MREKWSPKPGDKVLRVPRVKAWRMPLSELSTPKEGRLSPMILVYGFAGLIAIGSVLLMLPMASRTGQATLSVDAVFTATSAVCVTGLVVLDTGTYWSSFGQGVILVLIQLGGFGFMASATLLFMMLGQKVGLRERLLVRESMGTANLGGLVTLVKRIALFTLVTEAIGAAIFYFHFSSSYPVRTAVWKAVFQSISAFNNAGFDIWGNFRSLLDYQGDTLVMLVTAALIFLGGISFIVLADVFTVRRFSRLALDSKLVLVTTGSLLVLGMVVILFTELGNPDTLGGLPFPQKLLVAFFHSVTARTAGFSAIDMSEVADYSLLFIMFLMFVGGASGSTAGGIKVGTLGVLLATIWSSIR
ncbi:MAG: Trk family potassium uptake protein, partial [Dehalococcoidia bacterium]|nr:Trk family potassium uptake protein [Dehalococcoidia bacterium]